MRVMYYGSILFFLTFMYFMTLSGISENLWNIFWAGLIGYCKYRFILLAYNEYKLKRSVEKNSNRKPIYLKDSFICYNQYNEEIAK